MKRLWLWRGKEIEFTTNADGQRQSRPVRTFYFLGASPLKAMNKLGPGSKTHLNHTGDRLGYEIQKLTVGALWRSRRTAPLGHRGPPRQ